MISRCLIQGIFNYFYFKGCNQYLVQIYHKSQQLIIHLLTIFSLRICVEFVFTIRILEIILGYKFFFFLFFFWNKRKIIYYNQISCVCNSAHCISRQIILELDFKIKFNSWKTYITVTCITKELPKLNNWIIIINPMHKSNYKVPIIIDKELIKSF